VLFSWQRPDREARRRKIPLVGLRLRSNEARRPLPRKPSGRCGFWLWTSWSRTSQPAAGRFRPLRLAQNQNPQPQHHSQFSNRLVMRLTPSRAPSCSPARDGDQASRCAAKAFPAPGTGLELAAGTGGATGKMETHQGLDNAEGSGAQWRAMSERRSLPRCPNPPPAPSGGDGNAEAGLGEGTAGAKWQQEASRPGTHARLLHEWSIPTTDPFTANLQIDQSYRWREIVPAVAAEAAAWIELAKEVVRCEVME